MRFLPALFLLGFASAMVAQTSPPSPLPPRPAVAAIPLTDAIVFKASIDTTDYIVIKNGQLQIMHVKGKLPKEISVNGKNWVPDWKDNKSEFYNGFNPPLLPLTVSRPTLRRFLGRGDAFVTEEPTEANDYRLVIRVSDHKNGAGDVEVHIAL